MVGAEHRFLTFHDAKNRCSSVELAIHKLLKTRGVTELVSSLREENKKETQENNVPAIILHAKLQELVLCLSDPSGVPRIADADIEFLRSAAESHFLENGSRAKALNVLGRMSLQKAVEYRQLESAWDSEDSDELFFVEEAKEYFVAALRLLGDSFDLLTRNILRSFALVSAKQIPSWLSCSLITSSIGRFTSRHIEKLLSGETCSCQGESPLDGSQASHLLQLVNGVGDARSKAEISFEQFHHLANHMPSAWRFVSLALCESGELLVSSISAEDEAQDSLYFQTECISPRQDTNAESATIYDHLMVPLDRIIQQSQSNLNARSSTGSKPSSDSAEDTKRKWWAARKKMDSDLEELLSEVERKYFSSSEIKTLIFGHDGLDSMLSCGNLAAKFAAVSEPTDDMDPSELKVAELRDELMEYGMTSASVRKMRKKELVELVGQERKRRLGRKDEKPKDDRQSRGNKSDSYIFLILDENLQRFPFESMPCFDGKTVCRLPSLAFGVAALSPSNDMNTTDPTRVSYVIDPESNLSATQERLLPVVDSLSKKYGNNAWAGVVGQPPTIDFMEDQLRQPGGLLLYFGHGGGQQWLSRTTLQGMISPLGRQAKSSVVLMGCSSGRLESVNRKDCRYEKELPIHYEPEGIALSYLSAGAPCVVGNLWDVTDRDIDRYAQTVLERFFEGNLSLAQCVAEARSACKLRYMVGSAPVCYGMPVFCKKAK